MALKKTDYTRQRGIESEDFVRPCNINGKSQQLTVVLVKNNKKGLFYIKCVLNFSAVTGDDQLDIATIETLADLQMEARNAGLAWVKEWQKANPTDDDQLGLDFGDNESVPVQSVC